MTYKLLTTYLLFALLLSGCAFPQFFAFSQPTTKISEHFLTPAGPTEPVGELSEGNIVSQTFWSHHEGLAHVTLLLATYARENSGEAIFTLRDDTEQIVYQERFPAREVADNQPRLFRFPPQPESALRQYTVQLAGDGASGQGITLWADTTDRYLGRLDFNENELAGDMLIEWGYQPTAVEVWQSNAIEGIKAYGLTFVLTLLLWTFPGLAILLWLGANKRQKWSLSFLWAASLALSAAVLVILPQVTDLLRIRLAPWSVWLLLLVSIGMLLWYGKRYGWRFVERPTGSTFLYFLLVGLLIWSRSLAVFPLVGPQWGDSVHHALITELLIEHGGLFDSYMPYLPLAPFTYHAGFHLLSAWLAWAVMLGDSPLSGTLGILFGGQWFNVVAVVMVGLLAEGIARWRHRAKIGTYAALLAILFAGLLNEMPAYYVNWGRYTQLAGQIFLPPALLWSLTSWSPHSSRRELIPLTLVVAALALTHYRVLMMYAVALPILLAVLFWSSRTTWQQNWFSILKRAVISGVATCLIILPWYATLLQSLIVERAASLASTDNQAQSFFVDYNAFGNITQYIPAWLLYFALIGLLWLLIRHTKAAFLLSGWVGMLFLLSNPYILRLPGTGLVNNFMIQIALYIPAGTIVGLALADFGTWLLAHISPVKQVAPLFAALVIVGLGIRGSWQQGQLSNPNQFSLLTHSDQLAATWISNHTPPDATFHVNGFFAYGDSIIAGSDAGWWLSLTARRATTAPPIVYGHESSTEPNYHKQMNQRFRRLMEAQNTPEELADIMREEQIDYIYIGAQQGRVGLPPNITPLDPRLLDASPAFETIYTDDFAWVFQVAP